MSEQIVTILFSTLLGGVLTIAGGLAVSYVTHRQTASDEKRKELRDTIERIYKLTLDVDTAYMNVVLPEKSKYETDKNVRFLNNSIENITMLANLYASELSDKTQEYVSKISVRVLSEYSLGLIEFETFQVSTEFLLVAGKKYRKELATYLHSKMG